MRVRVRVGVGVGVRVRVGVGVRARVVVRVAALAEELLEDLTRVDAARAERVAAATTAAAVLERLLASLVIHLPFLIACCRQTCSLGK